jgi:hypothetical protein
VAVGDNRFDEYLLATSAEVGDNLVNGTVRSLRTIGVCSIVAAVLWGYGLLSIFAIGMSSIGLMMRKRAVVDPLPGVRLTVVGLVLGIAGLVAALVLFAV